MNSCSTKIVGALMESHTSMIKMNNPKKYWIAMLLIIGAAVPAIIFLYSRNVPQQETATSPVAQDELNKTV